MPLAIADRKVFEMIGREPSAAKAGVEIAKPDQQETETDQRNAHEFDTEIYERL
jgi:hypothetical protein